MRTTKTEPVFLLVSRKVNVPNNKSQADHALQQKINRLYLQDVTTCKQISLCIDADGTSKGTLKMLDAIHAELDNLKMQNKTITDIVFPTTCRIGRNISTVIWFKTMMSNLQINIHVAEPNISVKPIIPGLKKIRK
ncbi:MAG: hypothetical protein ACK5Z2_15080 [Bacteroidota bacterium]|jgi:hypothetical protein